MDAHVRSSHLTLLDTTHTTNPTAYKVQTLQTHARMHTNTSVKHLRVMGVRCGCHNDSSVTCSETKVINIKQ